MMRLLMLVCFDRVVIGLFTAFVLLAFSTFSHAGYYATITSNPSAYCGVPVTSGCYVTLSMAIGQSCPGIVKQIETIDLSSKTWSSTYAGHTTHDASGTYAECPGGASIPALAVGVVDPAISSSGSGGSGGASSADLTALQSTVSSLQTQLAAVTASNIQNSSDLSRLGAILNEPFELSIALAATGFFFGTTLSFYAIARTAGVILTAIKRPLGRGV